MIRSHDRYVRVRAGKSGEMCFVADVEAFGRDGGSGFPMACEFYFSGEGIKQLHQAVTDRGSSEVFVFLTHEGVA